MWWLAACDFGTVEQGRAVAFDASRDEVTVVLDAATTAGPADYRGDVVTYRLPHDAAARGPDPATGGVLSVDMDGDRATVLVYDGGVRTLALTDVADGTEPGWDAATRRLTVQVGKRIVSGVLAEGEPPSGALTAGDEVRVYLLHPPQAERFMNVTRTDIYKK